MTNHVARLYLLAASVLGLFVAWAGIAAAGVWVQYVTAKVHRAGHWLAEMLSGTLDNK